MAFGTDIHMEKADAGSIRGEQKSIAVGCWFTSKGDTSLQLLKYKVIKGVVEHFDKATLSAASGSFAGRKNTTMAFPHWNMSVK